MKLKSLKLTNWRNFLNTKIDFNSKVFVVGKNGRGKTNILEAIYLLSTTKSFRTNNNYQLINWEQDFCRLVGNIATKENPNLKIDLVINKNPQRNFQKRVKVNDASKKMFDVLGIFKVVLFSPEMMEIIYGSPSLRRRYLDSVLSVADRNYAKRLLNFYQVLKRRNKLLSLIAANRAKKGELDFWDGQLAEDGAVIILRRQTLIDFYNQELAKIYSDISGNPKDKLRLKYLNSLIGHQPGMTKKNLAKEFQQKLFQKRDQEIEIEATLTGPQRDEIIFVLNDRNITSFGSRGEYRSAILATKLVEIDFVTDQSNGDKPVMLLDDVFSELDHERRNKLSQVISQIQTIITTTDLSHIDKSLKQEAKIIKLD